MTHRIWLATAAAAPLLLMASGAAADTTITGSRTTAVNTATANNGAPDNVSVASGAQVSLSASGALVTVDSNNTLANAGTLTTTNVSSSTAILIIGGHTGSVASSGTISLLEDYTAPTTDDITHGAFATGSNRYGILLTGTDAFTGGVSNTGTITIEGNDSAGVWLNGPLVGNLSNTGTISITGDRGYGLRTSAPITGSVTVGGSISVTGEGSVGVAVDGNVSGAVSLQGSVTATGYRYSSRSTDAATLAKIISYPDNLLQGGPAVRIAGDVGGGLLLNGADYAVTVAGTTTTTVTTAYSDIGTASLISYGTAPALLVGSDSRDITVGLVGTGADAYGLINKGSIYASGVYNGFSATALQVGGANGYNAAVTGGIRQDGTVTAAGTEASGTAILLTDGASVDSLFNRGTIGATSYSYAGSGVTASARGIVIDAGANLPSLTNTGSIIATRTGETGDAIAVSDASGSLTSITNTGTVAAYVVAPTVTAAGNTASTTAAGRTVAFDLSANTTGVTLTQSAPVSTTGSTPGTTDVTTTTTTADTVTPTITGDILFGSGADSLKVLAGTVTGAISFGAGADSLTIDGGGSVYGALTDPDGMASLSIGTGKLTMTNAATIQVGTLNLGAGSTTYFTADAATGENSKFVAGTATVASGATIGLRLNGLVTSPTTYTVIQSGGLTSGSVTPTLASDAPYLYVASAYSDADNVYIDLRRRSAAEAGMSKGQASAYDAIFAALGTDATVASAFLNQYSQSGFYNIYNQLLPDTGVGIFSAVKTATQQISAATALRPDQGETYGPDSFWVQEINSQINIDDGDTPGSKTSLTGFVAGYESMGGDGGALGATLAVLDMESHDTAAQTGEQTSADFLQAGLYWRRSMGGWRFNLGGGAGFGRLTGDRSFISADTDGNGVADVVLHNSATWYAATANAFAGVGYEQRLGRYYVRPEGRLDYVYLHEGEQKESGGGSAFDLTVAARSFSNLSGDIGVAFGAQYGREVWWRPEVRIGYRQTLAGDVGDTVASFAGGSAFSLSTANEKQGAATLGLAIRGGTTMSFLALEGEVEAAKNQTIYNLRLSARAMF